MVEARGRWPVVNEGNPMRFRLLGSAAVAASLVMTAVPGAPVAGAATAARPAGAPAGEADLAGPWTVGPAGVTVGLSAGGRTYELPFTALPFLGRGLDPSLFDLTALRGREPAGRIPVRVRYRGEAVPRLPGVTITVAGRTGADSTGAGRTAAGYLTASSAAEFVAALARQYTADRARASYGADGMFAGGVSVSLAEDAATPSAGPQFPMHTLTITGTNLSGHPDTGDVVLVFNVDNGHLNAAIGSLVFRDGIAKVSVPDGHYFAIAGYVTLAGGNSLDVTDAHLDVLPQFAVTADTTVHTSAKAATSQVTMLTPHPAKAESSDFGVWRTPATGPASNAWISALHAAVWVNPVRRRPTVGGLRAYAAQQLASPAGPGVPYQYELSYTDPPGIIPPQSYRVRAASLATVADDFYQAVPSPGQWSMYGTALNLFPPSAGYINPYPQPIGLPGRQIRYVGGNAPETMWGDYFNPTDKAGTYIGGDSELMHTVRPGQRLTDAWNQYPLHPAPVVNPDPQSVYNGSLPSASREGDTLTVSVIPFDDNQPGHYSSGTDGIAGATTSGTYQIDQNGTQVAGGSVPVGPSGSDAFTTQATLTPALSTVRFELNMKQTGADFPLSTASTTVWTWRSAHEAGDTLPPGWYCDDATSSDHCRVEPMMTLLYHVGDMALNGTTPAGRQVMEVSVGHIQAAAAHAITGATVQFSVNDGKTWHDAPVTREGPGRYQAVYAAPAGAYVTLRTTATDAAGGRICETITRGYQIAP